MSGGSNAGNVSTTTQLDPDLKAQWLQFNDATKDNASRPFQEYGKPLVAADNMFEDLAQYRTLQAADMGQGTIDQARNVFGGVANDSPVWQDPALVNQTTQGQAGQIGDVLDVTPERAGTYDASAMNVGGQSLAPYMNPYQQQVIDQSNRELDRSKQMADNQNAYSASRAGAFGGSRHGILDAENERNFAQMKQDNTNGLLQSGYGQAQGLLQSDVDRQAGISTFNAGARNTASLNNSGLLAAAQTGNADRDLAARGADASARQAASFANAGADNQRNQFNAGQIQGANDSYRQADLAQSGLNLQGAQGLLSAAQQGQQQYLTGANALAASGASQRGIDQAGIDADLGQFQQRTGEGDADMARRAQAFGIIPSTANGGSQTSNSKSKGLSL